MFQKYRQRNEKICQLLQKSEDLTLNNIMIYIYYTDSKLVRQKYKLKDFIEKLPEKMHKRAYRYKFEKDGFNFVLGRLLLNKGLEDLGWGDRLENIRYLESGKPFLENVYFNISHTEGLVVCALSTKGEIGIDIEKVKQVKLDDFEAWFTKKEWAEINSSPSPLQKFYWYWTRKESIIKALSTNLSYLHKIEVDATKNFFSDEGKKWYLKDLDFGKGFTGALCSEIQISDLKQIVITDSSLAGNK